LVVTFFNFLFTELERSKVRNAFSQYMSPVMVEKLAQSSESLKLGGERKEMTFLFSDIRGFTSISEKYKGDPEALTDLINNLLTVLSNEILNNQGTIDKYMGDCIMAFWNAPSEDPEHREKSIDAAFAMSKALKQLNKDLNRVDEDKLSVGIGINTGECIVGNMGSDKRFDYTVLGDAVNLASRLEGQSGNYGMQIILGEGSIQGLSEDKYSVCELDLIAVKGKSEPVTIYTVFDKEDSTIVDENFLLEHQDFLVNYRNQNWLKAKDHIDKYRFSKTEFTLYYTLFLERIDDLSEQTLPNDWSGVFIAKTK
jgi:adenylate cyclase